MESRDEILADFQACTGIEDYGEAIQHLEDANWVLVDAVNRALPSSAAEGAPQLPPAVEHPPIEVIPDDDEEIPRAVSPVLHFAASSQSFADLSGGDGGFPGGFFAGGAGNAGPSSSSSRSMRGVGPLQAPGVSLAADFLPLGPAVRSRLLELHVEYRDKMIHLKVPDTETIQVVKTLLQAETGVPPCQQELRGWAAASSSPLFLPSDHRRLSELHLPKENFLYLLTPDIPAVVELNGEEEVMEVPEEPYKLTIINLKEGGKTYNLSYPSTKLVEEVKRDVATVTAIPSFRQVWTGWPDGCRDDMRLAQTGMARAHTLTVNQAPPSGRNMPILVDNDEVNDVELSEDEDYQDAPEHMTEDEDLFIGQDIPIRSGIQPLLPDDFGDEALAGIKFGEEFTNRYGQPAPHFFPGSLEDALAESCNKPAQERRMLAVYLHHDNSVLTNVFCTQVLCADPVVGMLCENFVCWGWDLTFNSNKQRLLDMISRHFGSVAAATIRNFEMEKLPLVILIAKLRGNLEIFQVIHGNITVDEFISSLLSAGENYQSQMFLERREEEERHERDRTKQEQEVAFQEAQLADQVKQHQQKEAEEEARLQEQLQEAKRRSEIEARELNEKRRQDRQAAALASLGPEPPANAAQSTANIRFRTPTETLTRRFLASDPLATILTFLASKGYMEGEFKILTSFPRKDLSLVDHSSSLASLKLCPQETLTLEARQTTEDSDSD